jgi:8-oxo-dGTP pyrophosphatase MutT (NUDIX family)
MTPRPAATVMLLRDTADGLAVFLLQRHSRMEFAPGTTVFPGGGVDDRDRDFDIAWAGPDPAWWAQRMVVDEDLALALV